MDVLFRPARRDDLAVLLELLRDDEVAQSRGDYALGVTSAVIAAFEAIEADANNHLWVGERQGEVVSLAQVTIIPGLSRGGAWRAQVEGVRVRADLRGEGIGTALMAWIIDHAEASGCRLIQLTTDARRSGAHRFYERLGFEASHVGMKLRLSRPSVPLPDVSQHQNAPQL